MLMWIPVFRFMEITEGDTDSSGHVGERQRLNSSSMFNLCFGLPEIDCGIHLLTCMNCINMFI